MNTVRLTPPSLKAGMIIQFYGGRFQVLADARASLAHLPYGGVGPSDCAAAPAVCLEGEVSGYFWPGSDWNFQGNRLASFAVEVDSIHR